MLSNQSIDPVRQRALTALMAQFVQQGHPEEYAQHMAMATIFQADLELRNAQLISLLSWIKQHHENLYDAATAVVESTREEFEKRVSQ
ncbi:MAG: hypothetical protein VKK04_07340 [Synechococcales bacterium]|nr:hypothetical protein [Synechococcales bacterium]